MYQYDPSKYNRKQLPIIQEALKKKQPAIPDDCTVLVVEDNVSNYFLLVRMLGHLGIRCEWKTSGYEVVEFADNLPRIDLILMDIRLPYEDGYEAMKKIKISDHFSGVPIVAVTAEGSMEQIIKAKAAGFDGFLGKPVDPDKFPDQIKCLLGGNQVWDLNNQ
jgi:two-component system, cell cycle response regulator DivK